MDGVNSRYRMQGNKVRVHWRNVLVWVMDYEQLQKRLDQAVTYAIEVKQTWTPQRSWMTSPAMAMIDVHLLEGAMAYLREHLAVTPDGELVNAKYATDTNTAWAAMGVKGGAM